MLTIEHVLILNGWLDNTSSNGNFNIGEENNKENENFVGVE